MHWHRPQLSKQSADNIGTKIKNKWYLGVFTRVNPYVTDEINGKVYCFNTEPMGPGTGSRGSKRDGYLLQKEVLVYENKYVKFFKGKPELPPSLRLPLQLF